MKKIILLSICILLSGYLFSQSTEKDENRSDALKIFFDCSECGNDNIEYIKREITYVNYVRDPKEAQVHILVSFQNTGSGGKEYKIFYNGQKELTGMNDTITCSTNANNTEDEIRTDFLHSLQVGLLRYVAKTKLIKDISIKYNAPEKTEEVKDNWDSWVFSLGSSAWINAEKSSHTSYIYSNILIKRITENWKYEINFDQSYKEEAYKIIDTTFYNKSLSSSALFVKSISPHWSTGISIGTNYSTYSNIKLGYYILPAFEYNFFPYSESSRKQLTVRYTIGYKHNDYLDSTEYNKMNEELFTENLGLAFKTIQKWGNINIYLYGQNYFHDFSKNSLSTSLSAEIRIIKGLSFNISCYYSFIRNQLSLRKEGASEQEILTRQKEQQTDFYYYFNTGLSYTFGSIYNNVVNPRFDN